MLARSVDQIPEPGSRPDGWRYEPKWDGYRQIAIVDDFGSVRIYSRRGTRLEEAFPELVGDLYASVPRATVIDGEIVRWSPQGRLDFDALHYRYAHRRQGRELAESTPCHLVCFDVLEAGGDDLRSRPLSERRRVLERLLADEPAGSHLALGLQTADVEQARRWYDELPAVGVEGIVAKPAASPYLPGSRHEWRKCKAYRVTEAVIGGVTGTREHPDSLLLGRHDRHTGGLRLVARSTRLGEAAARLAGVLSPVGPDGHPWPEVLPPSWLNREPLTYERVAPDTVAEIRVDPAISHGRWRHLVRFLRLRPDLRPEDLPPDLEM